MMLLSLQTHDEEDEDEEKGDTAAALAAFKSSGLGSSPTLMRVYLDEMGKVGF